MASFSNDGSGLLKSATLEGALLELCQIYQNAEDAAILDDEELSNNMAVDFLTGQKLATIQWNTPLVIPTLNGNGMIELAVDPILMYSPSFSGTPLSGISNYEPALWELFNRISRAETDVNNVSITIDLDSRTAAVTANLPIEIGIASDGALSIVATEYIPDPVV